MKHRSRLFTVVLTLSLVANLVGWAADSPRRSGLLRFPHASIAAYPDAVVSLNDPTTGMTFYVESDGRRLVALDRAGGLVWGVDVLDEAGIEPYLGQPVVRHLTLDGQRLGVVCGKKDFLFVDVKTGEVEYSGRD